MIPRLLPDRDSRWILESAIHIYIFCDGNVVVFFLFFYAENKKKEKLIADSNNIWLSNNDQSVLFHFDDLYQTN